MKKCRSIDLKSSETLAAFSQIDNLFGSRFSVKFLINLVPESTK